MHWDPSACLPAARVHTLASRRSLSRRPAPRRLLAAAAVTIAIAAIPVFAGATTGASAASGGTTVSIAPGPFGSMLVVGSGMFAGYALYYITGDAPPNYSCTTTSSNYAQRTRLHRSAWQPKGGVAGADDQGCAGGRPRCE